MKEIVLNIGGKLETGDVVGIAYNNCTYFGWYVEPGLYGSLKYLSFAGVVHVASLYDDFTSGKTVNSMQAKRFSKGLNYKSFYKDYILAFGPQNNRAFKVSNPEEFFKGAGETEQKYLKGREALKSIKFPAK